MNIQKLLYQNIFWRGLFYLLGFILNILIARHFKSELTGSLYYLINVYAFITLIASVSLESGITYFASSKKISELRLLNFSLVWVVGIGLIIFILSLFIPFFSGILINTNQFLFALFFVCGNILITFLNSLFYSNNKFVLPNIIGIFINFLLIIFIFFVNNKYWFTNEKYIFIYFTSFLLQGVILAGIYIRNLTVHYQFSFPPLTQLRELFKYCLLAFVSNVVTFFYYRIDYWFVHHYRSAAELGNYIQVSKIAQMFFVLPAILASAVFPLTAGGFRREVNDMLMIITRSILFLYSIACFFLALTGRWLFPFIFGDTFGKMYFAFLFLIPGVLALSSLYTFTAYYAGKNRVITNLKGSFLALLTIVTGDALFIPRFGINAAAAVSSLGYIVYQIYVLSVFKKEYKTSLLGFFTFKYSDLSKIRKSAFQNFIN